MPTLADQVREMMRILEVVDPQAAAQIKGHSITQPSVAAPVVAPVAAPAVAPTPVQTVKARVRTAPAAPPIEQDHEGKPESPFLRGLTSDRLVQGIIWSEIISKPISKRRQRRI